MKKYHSGLKYAIYYGDEKMILAKPKNSQQVDMTKGNMASVLIKFAVPLLLGNLFQQLYNMVDTYVIGQTHNNAAYAAVGSVAPIINIFIGFFGGFAAGTGAIISQYFGAKDKNRVEKTVHTAITTTFILCIIITFLGLIFTPTMVKLLLRGDVNAGNLYFCAKRYLTIYFAGISGMLIYNMGAGILRAIGDSNRPFYYLIAAAITNVALDFLFVFGYGMQEDGVAIATIIAQFLSAILVLIQLYKTKSWVKVKIKELKIDFKILLRMINLGFPAGLQLSLTAFSNVFVQSYIGNVNIPMVDASASKSIALGSWTTYSKVDQLIFLPMQSLSTAAMTFVGQNIGGSDIKRAKKGTYTTFFIAATITIILISVIIIFAPFISAIFNNDVNVVKNATMLLRTLTPFYIFCCVNQVFTGAIRGAGRSAVPMVIMFVSFVGIRQIYLFVVSNYISNDFIPIAVAYPVGWIICCISLLIYFFNADFNKNKVLS